MFKDGLHLIDSGKALLVHRYFKYFFVPQQQHSTLDISNSLDYSIALFQESSVIQLNETHSNDANAYNSLEKICSLRMKKVLNPLIVYLNINSLRNKIIDVREIF